MPELYVEMVDSFHQFIPPTEGVYVSQSLLIAHRQLIIKLDECQRPGHHHEEIVVPLSGCIFIGPPLSNPFFLPVYLNTDHRIR